MQSRTPEETQAITHWRNQNRRTIRNNYPHQYIACGISEVLAAGASYDLVEAAAKATNKPFIIDWIPAGGDEVSFYKFVQAEERIEFEWRGAEDAKVTAT